MHIYMIGLSCGIVLMLEGPEKTVCPDPRMSKLGFEPIFVKSRGFVNGMVSGTKQTALL